MLNQLTTHATLLARLAKGDDPSAWREFQERYGALILAVARRQGLQPADCDDIAQNVLLALTQTLPGFKYDPARGRFRGFLNTLVLRAVYRRLRQKPTASGQVNWAALPDDAGADSPLGDLWEEEWRDYHVRQAMRTIAVEFAPLHRAAFEAYVIEGADARATAERLGLTLDLVYQIKSRILRRLTELIDQQVLEEG